MPTRKIADIPEACRHPEHNPPSHQVFEPGVYEHVCPACGARTVFRVNRITCNADPLIRGPVI